MTHIRVRVPIRDTGCCARARALRPRLPRARCAAVAPRAHHAVTGARHRVGVAYARRPPLRDAGQYLRRQPPRWDAGRLRSVGLSARVDAAQAAALARGPCAHRCGDFSPPLYVAARVCPAPVGPSGLRARRGRGIARRRRFCAASRARARRVASSPCRDDAPVSSRGAKAPRAGLAARVILITGRVRILLDSRRAFRYAARCSCQAV